MEQSSPIFHLARAAKLALARSVLLIGLWPVLLFSPGLLSAAEIAILKSSDIAAYNQAVAGLRAELPGSVAVTEYDMQGDVTRGRKLARKIRASDASLVVAIGLKAALVAKLEVVDVLLMYCMVLDPEKYDLRGPNITGIGLQIPIERQFSAMRSVLPKLKRIGVIYDPEKTGPLVEEARRWAKGLNLELVERRIRSEKELPDTLRALIAHIDALWLVPDSTVLTEDSLRFVLATGLDHNVPVIGFSSEFVRSGALIGLSVNPEDIGRQAGILVKKMLNGERNSSFLVPPDRIRFALNLKTAKFLGLTIPPDIVARADEVF